MLCYMHAAAAGNGRPLCAAVWDPFPCCAGPLSVLCGTPFRAVWDPFALLCGTPFHAVRDPFPRCVGPLCVAVWKAIDDFTIRCESAHCWQHRGSFPSGAFVVNASANIVGCLWVLCVHISIGDVGRLLKSVGTSTTISKIFNIEEIQFSSKQATYQ